MSKNNSLVPKGKDEISQPSSGKNSIVQNAKQVLTDSAKKIQEGLSKPTASTGTPMDKLNGGAKTITAISNIGGGSKATGGDGILGGMKTLVDFASAKSALEAGSSDENIGTIESPNPPKLDQ